MTNRYEFMALCSGLAFCTLLLWGNPSWPYVGILAMSLVLLTVFFLLLAKLDKMELFNKGRFSNWLAVQELNELRTIDLQVLASELGLSFSKKSPELNKKLKLLLEPIKTGRQRFENFIEVNSESGTYILFDFAADLLSRRERNILPSDPESLTGIYIEHDDINTPRFLVARVTVQAPIQLKPDGLWNSNRVEQILGKKLPSWLPMDKFICFCAESDEEVVSKFLISNPSLEQIIKTPAFRLAGFNGNAGTIFFNSSLDNRGSNFFNYNQNGLVLLGLQRDYCERDEENS